MKKIFLVSLFAFIVVGVFGQQVVIADSLAGCWVDSREENSISNDEMVFRPCDYMNFPVSRFRFKMDLFLDSTCKWMYLHPSDAHHMKPGEWVYNLENSILEIIEGNTTVKRYQVLYLDRDLLKLKSAL